MKKLLLLSLVAVLGGQVATSTQAGDTSKAAPDVSKEATINQIYNDLTLTGTIEKRDLKTGVLVLRNDVLGDVPLQFKPNEVQNLKPGEKAIVELGFGVNQRGITATSCKLLPVRLSTC